nr:unnamed protein product [Callosobruchus chinensis]
MATKSHCLHLKVFTFPWEFTLGILKPCSSNSSTSLSDLLSSSAEHSLSLGDKAEGRKPFFSKLIWSLLKGSSLSFESSWFWVRSPTGEPRGVNVRSPLTLTGEAVESTVGGVKGLWSFGYSGMGVLDIW